MNEEIFRIENLNLTIEPKTKVGLVGFSGSGKSTFINLIMRYFDVDGGSIELDGYDIRNITQKSLRKNIAYIPQDPTLFHRSIRENIAYGKPNATENEIIEAAKKASCYDFIMGLENKFDSLVGERGVKLSGGQRQRIAIARVILKDSPILIMDEATSALDSVTEKEIQTALKNMMEDRTVIVIAHRLSTLQNMDRILVFDNGKIIEDGKHTELLNRTYIKDEKTGRALVRDGKWIINEDKVRTVENGLAVFGRFKELWDLQVEGFIQDF